jgi:acyl-coenzyme A synthetase/AMP-(fatty) acid ligase/acyl carrier protein
MASMLLSSELTRDAFAPLDMLLIGGEAFPRALADELRTVTRAKILNMYGPTETTIWSTTHVLNGTRDSIPIGRPIANTQLYIMDRNRQPVPIGVPGELMIGGGGVVRGYLNRPDLTSQRFVNIHLDSTERRVYRTGDLARYRADGDVEFLGRIDHQVKIRGYRIELGEIESLLERNAAVREAVVIAREDVPGDKRLVAYVVTKTRGGDITPELREQVRETLPDYMVPAHFVLLDEMPRTPNAKIDRKALPAPESAMTRASVYVQPQNELEQTIAAIWQDILKVSQVGTGDNFFDLGGHSLLAVQVHGRLRKVAPRELSITDLFRFPTIRALAGYLGQEEGDDAAVKKGFTRAEARRQSMTRRPQRR